MIQLDNMNEMSPAEIARIVQLKNEKPDRWGSAFEHHAWAQQFRENNPLCSHPHILILEAPLDSPEIVQNSINLANPPPIEYVTLDEDDGEEEQRGKKITKVCMLDDSSHKAIHRWICLSQECRHKNIWVYLRSERRLAIKLRPYPSDYMTRF